MDIFESCFSMRRKNALIFEKYKMTQSGDIIMTSDVKEQLSKRGKELLTENTIIQFMEVRSIHYHNVVEKKLLEYSLAEWIVCLNEKVLLEYTIPIFLPVLEKYPMLCGMTCEWQILFEMTKIDNNFWEIHKDWAENVVNIIKDAASKFLQTTNVIAIPKEYIRQWESFVMQYS